MRKSSGLFFGFLLLAAAASAAPCTPSATSLCLSGGRFEVSVAWTDFQSHTGAGQAVSLTADTGYFWFFSDSNVELIVKVLDARGINGKFWVFFGALSNVEYTLTVRDGVSGSTKTYVNPSGRFASVGDTAAFEGAAAAAASHEIVTAPGTAASPAAMADMRRRAASPKASPEFTPCPETRFGFDIGNCRFHIEVEWDDGHGGVGVGQPVQITNDTGYFWFFSPTNVELMIKVLDARPVNGKFWVFFGALSNVRYTIKVVDRITNASRKYSNPSGTFASVGDTGGFNGGYTVNPVADAGLAVSADLDLTGGSVAAAGADGTLFILDVPARALPVPETVTLRPVSRIDHLPFSGGLVAGVEIEPAGLDLLAPATLTIRPPSPPAPERTLPYSYQAGEDFILYPRDPDPSSIRLPLARFGGYGIAEGGLNEAEAQAARTSTAVLGAYLQRYALEVLHRGSGAITPAELEGRGGQIFQEAYHEQVEPLLPPALRTAAARARLKLERTCYLGEMQEFLDLLFRWIRDRQMLGLPDLEENGQTGTDIAIAKISACAEESFRLCVDNHDPGEMLLLLQLARQLEELGLEDVAVTTMMEGSLIERCLRFELQFTSEFKLEQIHPEFQLTESVGYHATVPLRFLYGGNDIFPNMPTFEGGCAMGTDGATMTLMADPDSHCRAGSAAAGPGWFTVKAAQINLSILSNELWMVYDVGYPSFQASIVCEGTTLDVSLIPFGATYLIVHEGELSPAYGLVVNNWRPLRYLGSSPGDWAEKEYIRTLTDYGEQGTVLFENTRFFLRHTPDGQGCQ